MQKLFYQNQKLVSQNDFEKKVYKEFVGERLSKYEDATKKITYDANGKESYKEITLKNGFEIYKNGILRQRNLEVKNQIISSLYDQNGNLTQTETKPKPDSLPLIEVAHPIKHAFELSEKRFEYLKKRVK